MGKKATEAGRLGKRWDPAYTQMTAYVPAEVHLAMKKRLLEEGREISELAQELLENWLQATKQMKKSERDNMDRVAKAVLAVETALASPSGVPAQRQLPLYLRFLAEWTEKMAREMDNR